MTPELDIPLLRDPRQGHTPMNMVDCLPSGALGREVALPQKGQSPEDEGMLYGPSRAEGTSVSVTLCWGGPAAPGTLEIHSLPRSSSQS